MVHSNYQLRDVLAMWYMRNVLIMCRKALFPPAMISRICNGHSVLTTSQLTYVAIHKGSVSFLFNLSASHRRIAEVKCCFAPTRARCVHIKKSAFCKKNQPKLVPPMKLQEESPAIANLYNSVWWQTTEGMSLPSFIETVASTR